MASRTLPTVPAHAFAPEAPLIAVAQFDGFMAALARACGNDRLAGRPRFAVDFDFDRWISAAVEHFAGVNASNCFCRH